jgi:transposase
MKQFTDVVGVDVSKLTLDAWLHQKGIHLKVENNRSGFESLRKWIKQNCGNGGVLWCFEHTGIYSMQLATYLSGKKIQFSMVSALEIKKSLGVVRGKNDKVDAKRIAEYAYLRRDKIKSTTLPSESVQKIKQLLVLRERMVGQRAGYLASLKEFQHVFRKSENPELFYAQENIIKALSKNIDMMEDKIQACINEDPEITKQFQLITSVVGIGPIIGAHFIVTTNCFTSFQEARKYACYSGVAPFQRQSGKSLNSNAKVSQLANKTMKTLLDRAASTAILYDPELKLYYNRRVREGKSKRSILNVVRNKIIYRVFAVIKRRQPYVKIHGYAA